MSTNVSCTHPLNSPHKKKYKKKYIYTIYVSFLNAMEGKKSKKRVRHMQTVSLLPSGNLTKA